MPLFNIFNRKPKSKEAGAVVIPEVTQLKHIDKFFRSLLDGSHYIARSEYSAELDSFKPTIEYFSVLQSSRMLDAFCSKNRINPANVKDVLSRYNSFKQIAEQFNEEFIQKHLAEDKHYLDNILKQCDPNIALDDDQRRVVLTDEDYCLVIAGAGAGKTTTVAAKVKYLVDKQQIDPKQILVVSFTNKAVKELRDRINDQLGIACPIATFHSTGNAILHKQNPKKLKIADESKLYYTIQSYFRSSILKNESTVNNLILFFASYFDVPNNKVDIKDFFNNIAKANYSTMRSEVEGFKRDVIDANTKKSVSILSEVMRSRQEVEIANFLYLNSIDYEYEPLYKYNIQYARKPYTPDFCITQNGKTIYIEHFGITEDGQNNRYSQEELDLYKKAVKDKVLLHKRHGTELIYTFSSYNDGRSITDHLREELEKKSIVLTPKSNKEILEKLVSSEENRYIKKIVSLITRFIQNFKTNGCDEDDFDRMYTSTQNERSRLFLSVCKECYLEYQKVLHEDGSVDFEDMINESARILREVKEMKRKLDFKYIIVDEYQDISRQRFDLVTELHNVTDAKIIAVGDDWQSIFAFAGADITLFTQFEKKMGYAKLLKIVKTYRNSQEVIDIAGNFIQRNQTQIQKTLKSNKQIKDPVIIYTYDASAKAKKGEYKTGSNYALACAVEEALGQIIDYGKKEGRTNPSILLLGRFGFDGNNLERSGLFEFRNYGSVVKSVRYPELKISFMTAHASKGLGYDEVIVINGRNETYGFPSKIEDDPVLSFVIKTDRSIDYAEERRLFYVAMTRTKNRVYFIAPENNPSEFLLEIKKNFRNVVLKGEWNEDESKITDYRKRCPICGYPLQYKYKNAYGLKLYLCTNEPEVCSFMTNDLRGEKLSIIKCDGCRDGYQVVRHRGDKYFLGCTNYKADGSGCSHATAKSYYYQLMGYEFSQEKEIAAEITEKEKSQETHSNILQGNKEIKKSEHKIDDNHYMEVKNEMEKKIVVSYKNRNLYDIPLLALNCLTHISGRKFWGVSRLVEVLHGSKSDIVIKNDLNNVDEYGKLNWMPVETIKVIIEWLIENGYILQTKGKYPVLHITAKGIDYSKNITKSQLEKLMTRI